MFHQHILLIACEPLLNLMTNYLICVAWKQWEALRFTIEVTTCMVRCLIEHYCAIAGTILIFRFLTIWSYTCVGERSNFKIFLRTCKIMVMHSNEREECRPRTLKLKRYDNAVDVVVRLHGRPIPSTERTTPPRSAHVQLGDVPRTHNPVEL